MGINVVTMRWMEALLERGVLRQGMSILDLGPQDIVVYTGSDAEKAALGDHAEPGSYYRSIGLGRYESLDRNDERATWRLDLNRDLPTPWDHAHRCDIIANFGTLEHVFNIATAFRLVHELLNPGGVALHVLPAAGETDHGFYNIHPQVYRDLAAANGYVIEDYRYMDGIDARCIEAVGGEPVADAPLKDYCYVALRKVTDGPFVIPQQGQAG